MKSGWNRRRRRRMGCGEMNVIVGGKWKGMEGREERAGLESGRAE
jgi:hypothetical protein